MAMHRRNLRAGFTAIEILIVVAIIALLMTIAAGAIVKVRAAAERTATETTLTKLASMLDRHWKAVIESAKKEYDGLPVNIKQNLVALADNATASPATPKPHPRRDDRARLLYVKFRLKQEFPNSFEQAVDPDPTFGRFLPPTVQAPAIPQRGNTAATGNPAFVKFIVDFYTKANSPTPQNLSWKNNKQFPTPKYQSAMLLALTLEQARGGMSAANLEQEVGTTFLLTGFEDAEAAKAAPAKKITLPRYLVDAWGNPLQFYIFPAYNAGGNPSTTDLDVTFNFVPANKTVPVNQQLRERLQSGGGPDPQDPEGLLLNASISQWTPPAIPGFDFAMALHPQIMPTFVSANQQQTIFAMRRMVPAIVSAGPDGRIGSLLATPNAPDDGWAASNPSMTMQSADCFDNLYSFRLRQTGAKGE